MAVPGHAMLRFARQYLGYDGKAIDPTLTLFDIHHLLKVISMERLRFPSSSLFRRTTNEPAAPKNERSSSSATRRSASGVLSGFNKLFKRNKNKNDILPQHRPWTDSLFELPKVPNDSTIQEINEKMKYPANGSIRSLKPEDPEYFSKLAEREASAAKQSLPQSPVTSLPPHSTTSNTELPWASRNGTDAKQEPSKKNSVETKLPRNVLRTPPKVNVSDLPPTPPIPREYENGAARSATSHR
ncbi:hypothetical protein KPG66_16520 [Mycetohabitans sp. B2]|nr:hypothetical protein [Mycetohabitans sp. B2]MCF7697577.1 hypothetical protein [Mycetohabitans sp. B2]